MTKTALLRQYIESPEILLMPGVYDGFSARIAERFGFKAAIITGAGVSESRLGWPDVGLMGKEIVLETARRLAECTDIPLLADIDTGYGNAVSVYYAVRSFEAAGVAGVAIEDQVWPKRCGHLAGKQVIAAEEMVEKIQAAVEARRDPNFIIKARTDAAGVLGVKEAIRRLQLYAEAGADHLVADALLSVEDIQLVARHAPAPLAVNMGFGIRSRPTTPLISPRRLQEMGVAVVTYPRLFSAAAVQGMMAAAHVLLEAAQETEPKEYPHLAVSFVELSDLMGLPVVQALEERYSSSRAR